MRRALAFVPVFVLLVGGVVWAAEPWGRLADQKAHRHLQIKMLPAAQAVVAGEAAVFRIRVDAGGLRLRVHRGLPVQSRAVIGGRMKDGTRDRPRKLVALRVKTDPATPAGTYRIRVLGTRPGRGGQARSVAEATLRVVAAHPVATPSPTPNPVPTPIPSEEPAPVDGLKIAGHTVGDLVPGASEPLDLTLTNTTGSDLEIGSLAVAISAIDAPRADEAFPCGEEDFTVVPFSEDHGGLVLPAGSTRTLSELGVATERMPRIEMLDRPVDQDGCKGATLSLSYTGYAIGGKP